MDSMVRQRPIPATAAPSSIEVMSNIGVLPSGPGGFLGLDPALRLRKGSAVYPTTIARSTSNSTSVHSLGFQIVNYAITEARPFSPPGEPFSKPRVEPCGRYPVAASVHGGSADMYFMALAADYDGTIAHD